MVGVLLMDSIFTHVFISLFDGISWLVKDWPFGCCLAASFEKKKSDIDFLFYLEARACFGYLYGEIICYRDSLLNCDLPATWSTSIPPSSLCTSDIRSVL